MSLGTLTRVGKTTSPVYTGWLDIPDAHSINIVIPPPVVAPNELNVPELLVKLHDQLSLTWDQLASYFGVSRRAVHLWLAGGRMKADNQHLLKYLVDAVKQAQNLGSGAEHDKLLNAIPNIVDAERARRSSRPDDINRPPETCAPLEY